MIYVPSQHSSMGYVDMMNNPWFLFYGSVRIKRRSKQLDHLAQMITTVVQEECYTNYGNDLVLHENCIIK